MTKNQGHSERCLSLAAASFLDNYNTSRSEGDHAAAEALIAGYQDEGTAASANAASWVNSGVVDCHCERS